MNPLRKLDVVSNDLPDPPYPADVRARGWKFELDVERIEQSDTWDDAPPDMRPWLLMLWMQAWKQAPCGSLPANDDRIASRIGMDSRVFAGNREILMSGWYRCSDGRLYHPVITELVEQMRDGRRKEREKKAAQRAKTTPDVPGDTHGTPPGIPGESDGSPPTGTGTGTGPGTGTGTGKETPPPKGDGDAPAALVSLKDLVAEGIEKQVAADWLKVRKAKRLPLTLTAWEGTKAEAAKANLPIAIAIKTSVLNSWGGFKASWLEMPETKHVDTTKATAEWLAERDRHNAEALTGAAVAKKVAEVKAKLTGASA